MPLPLRQDLCEEKDRLHRKLSRYKIHHYFNSSIRSSISTGSHQPWDILLASVKEKLSHHDPRSNKQGRQRLMVCKGGAPPALVDQLPMLKDSTNGIPPIGDASLYHHAVSTAETVQSFHELFSNVYHVDWHTSFINYTGSFGKPFVCNISLLITSISFGNRHVGMARIGSECFRTRFLRRIQPEVAQISMPEPTTTSEVYGGGSLFSALSRCNRLTSLFHQPRALGDGQM